MCLILQPSEESSSESALAASPLRSRSFAASSGPIWEGGRTHEVKRQKTKGKRQNLGSSLSFLFVVVSSCGLLTVDCGLIHVRFRSSFTPSRSPDHLFADRPRHNSAVALSRRFTDSRLS